MLLPENTVIKYTGADNPSWRLERGNLYAVITDLTLVEQNDFFLTVWNDGGTMSEIYEGEYIIVSHDEESWWEAKPLKCYVEYN